MQVTSKDPFPPFHAVQTLCEGSFSSLHGLQTVSEGSFSLFHGLQTLCEVPFSPFHGLQTVCEGSFLSLHLLQGYCRRSFSPFTNATYRWKPAFSFCSLPPTIAIPYPLSRENHPKIQKKPPFCSSLAILTAKIPPFPQLERKEGWQPRRCPKGKNKKADLKKGKSYISLGGSSGFMLVDWKGAPPAKIKTTARSPGLLSRPHSSSQSESPSLYQRHNEKPYSQQAVRFGKCLRIGVLHSVQLYSLLEILVAREQKG